MDDWTDNQWLVIINPNAGRKKGMKDWGRIAELLSLYEFEFTPAFSQRPLSAIRMAREFIQKGYRKIIVVGGDGTMNEVINGLFQQDRYKTTEVLIGMIPVGTGNDWGRMFGVPDDYEQAISIIKNCQTYIQDAGQVKYTIGDKESSRYFINIAGMGFDALVTRKSNRLKEKGRGGSLLYFINIFTTMFSYRYVDASIQIDGKTVKNKVFSLSLGIGKYNGGGMMQLPTAIADDGLFDLTLIKKISKPDLIFSLKRLYNGTIGEHPKVETFTGKEIRIDSKNKLLLETDGESLGHAPLEFSIIPRSVKVITGTASV